MAGSAVDLPPGVKPDDSHMAMLLTMSNAVHGSTTGMTFDEPADMQVGDPIYGICGVASNGQGNEMGELRGVAEGSRPTGHDSTDTDDGVVFKKFKQFPLEIRSMIWQTAAEAAKPNGVYLLTYKRMYLGAGPKYPDLSDTILTHLHKIPPSHPLARSIHDLLLWSFKGDSVLTFTPSAALASMTRGVRDVFRSCSEARTELMRSPELSSSFDFHYMKGGKCNLGSIRPFYYDTDWISMDGHVYDRAGAPPEPGTPAVRYTPDVGRIQHFAFHYTDGLQDEQFRHSDTNLDIFHLLNSLKSLGYYQPSFCIRRVSHWDRLIQPDMRLFLKGFPLPSPESGRASSAGPQLNGRRFRKAMSHVKGLALSMGYLSMLTRQNGWCVDGCNFGGLKYCFLIHADSQKGLDLMEFKEDGSHLDNVDLEDLGPIGEMAKWVQTVANRRR